MHRTQLRTIQDYIYRHHIIVKEREQAVSERERKVQEWENAQREAAKNHGFYGVAQIEEHNYRNVIYNVFLLTIF